MNKVMVTFKRFRSMGLLAGLFFTVCLLAAPAAHAQLVEATILTTNVDFQKKKLYVEMNYTPKACGQYQLRFKLKTGADPAGRYAVLKLDSVITNNTGTPKMGKYTLPPTVEGGAEIDVLNLDNTAVGGYNLRFAVDLDPMVTAAEHPQVCMETYKLAYHSKRTGAADKDEVFTSRDIASDCPYTGDDVVACRKRPGGAKNWEAFIQDPRDCKVYNVVQVGNRWWFAQNLNYQKDLTAEQAADATGVQNTAFFCPGRRQGSSTLTAEWGTSIYVPEGKWSCDIYGALYTWNTARALDGGAPGTVASESTLPDITTPSSLRGICPPSWFLPNDADWGIMLNRVDGCSTPENYITQLSPLTVEENCSHFTTLNDAAAASDVVSLSTTTAGVTNAALNSYPLGKEAGRWLRSGMCVENPSGGVPVYCDDAALNAGANPPAYATKWSRTENAGTDHWGLKMLPAGYRYSPNDANGRFYGRGEFAVFLSSTRWSGSEQTPVLRMVKYNEPVVRRGYAPAAVANYNAYSVRCVR